MKKSFLFFPHLFIFIRYDNYENRIMDALKVYAEWIKKSFPSFPHSFIIPLLIIYTSTSLVWASIISSLGYWNNIHASATVSRQLQRPFKHVSKISLLLCFIYFISSPSHLQWKPNRLNMIKLLLFPTPYLVISESSFCIICHRPAPLSSKMPGVILLQEHVTGYSKCLEYMPSLPFHGVHFLIPFRSLLKPCLKAFTNCAL